MGEGLRFLYRSAAGHFFEGTIKRKHSELLAVFSTSALDRNRTYI